MDKYLKKPERSNWITQLMLVQPIGPSNTKSPKFFKMAVSYFVDPVLGYL